MFDEQRCLTLFTRGENAECQQGQMGNFDRDSVIYEQHTFAQYVKWICEPITLKGPRDINLYLNQLLYMMLAGTQTVWWREML